MKIQATGFVYQGKGILLAGAPGIGKTSLMLEMIRSGGQLVGDDGVALSNNNGSLVMDPPEATRGLIELRGVGILRLDPADGVMVTMHVCLVGDLEQRLPEQRHVSWLGVNLPSFDLLMDGLAPGRLHALAMGQYLGPDQASGRLC